MKRGLSIFLYGAGVAGVFAILLKLKLPLNTFLWREIHNTGHTPLFAILAGCLLGLLLKIPGSRTKPSLSKYFLVFVITIGLGIAYEIYQIWGGGDPDIIDVVRDVGGALPALGLAMIFDNGLDVFKNQKRRKIIIGIIAVLIWISAFIPLGVMASAYVERDRIFPIILDFDSPLETKFVKMHNASLETVGPPPEWSQASGKVGKINLMQGSYPGIGISEPYPDWSAFKFLKFDLYSTQPGPIRMAVRVDDAHHNYKYNDRFTRSITVVPGENEIVIPLEDVKNGPTKRKTDMKNITNLLIFSGAIKDEFSIYIDNVRLE